MKNEIIVQSNQELIQKLVLNGDLSQMTPQQKVQYYNAFCNALGLNPLTQPFALIKFQGKERLYAQKDCTEQLRKIHGVSITEVSTTSLNDVFIVTAKAMDKDGKTDCSTGAVNIKGLTGDNLANALMKAETKAKRRVTLSICGLGILDESETETLGKVEKQEPIQESEIVDVPTKEERQMLINLVYSSTLDESIKSETIEWINTKCNSYKAFEKMQHKLEDAQQPLDQIVNPNQKDINAHVKKVAANN